MQLALAQSVQRARSMLFLQPKPFVSLLCLGVVSLSSSGIGRADTPAHNSARREIAAVYVKRAQATVRKDLTLLGSTEAPDYQATTLAGITRSREQELEMMRRLVQIIKQLPSTQSATQMQTKILSLTWRGPDAIVMAQTTVVSRAAQGGKTMRSEAVVTTRDYWSHNSGGWQLRQSVERAGKAWINGQRIQ